MRIESPRTMSIKAGNEAGLGRPRRLSRHDRTIVGLLGFFIVVAFTVELYWVAYHNELPRRSQTDFLAFLFAIYSAGDQAYYQHVSYFALGLETINVFFTQFAHIWLIFAIIRRRPYRHALQLAVSSYLVYSVVLYFWVAYLSGYENMPTKSTYAFFIFVTPNLPWLLANVYLAAHSAAAITRYFRQVDERMQ